MKKILKQTLLIGSVLFAVSKAEANISQNAVTFNNNNASLGQVFFDTVGAGAHANDTVSAQFFFGNSNSRDALTESSGVFTFVNANQGFLNGAPFNITSSVVVGGTAGFYQMRAWTGGSSFDNATLKRGESVITAISFSGLTGGGTSLPPTDLNLHSSFAITTAVPEPATLALGIFGAAGLLFRRRK